MAIKLPGTVSQKPTTMQHLTRINKLTHQINIPIALMVL